MEEKGRKTVTIKFSESAVKQIECLWKGDLNGYVQERINDYYNSDWYKKDMKYYKSKEYKEKQKQEKIIDEKRWKDIDNDSFNKSHSKYWASFLKENFSLYDKDDPMLNDLKIITKYRCAEFVDFLHYMWYMKLHRDKTLFPISRKKLIINPVDFDLRNPEFYRYIDNYVFNFEVKEFVRSTFSRKITDFEYEKYKNGLIKSGEWNKHHRFIKGCAYNDQK